MKAELRLARRTILTLAPLVLKWSAALVVTGAVTGALAGCQEKKQAAPSHATAVGEVLQGSVSDAMLPVDTVRSQPPLAPKIEASGARPGNKPDGPQGQGKPAPGGDAVPEPAPEAPAAAPAPPPVAE